MIISPFLAISEKEQFKALLEYVIDPEEKYKQFLAMSAHADIINDIHDLSVLGVRHVCICICICRYP